MTDTATTAQAVTQPGRNLALFLDGTTDLATGNTNVWRLKSMCAFGPDSRQLVFYSAGVGTSFGEKVRGGAFGYGIDDVVAQAYLWLMEHYDEDAGRGEIDDSFKAFLHGSYALLHAEQRYWRTIDRAPEARTTTVVHTINETIDGSVFDRCRALGLNYAPPNLTDWAARHSVKLADLNGSRLAGDPGIQVPD